MLRYLVTLNHYGLQNVGIFEADNYQRAAEKAAKQWHLSSTDGMQVAQVDSLPDGWSYYDLFVGGKS